MILSRIPYNLCSFKQGQRAAAIANIPELRAALASDPCFLTVSQATALPHTSTVTNDTHQHHQFAEIDAAKLLARGALSDFVIARRIAIRSRHVVA